MLKRTPEVIMLGACSLAGVVFFSLTNPAHLPPAALMAGFLILFGVSYSALLLLIRLSGSKERLSVSSLQGLLIGAAALPVILLAIQSLGQLTLRDIITLAVLYITGYFYISRLKSVPKKN